MPTFLFGAAAAGYLVLTRFISNQIVIGVATVLLGLLSVAMLRKMVRTGAIRNPSGSDDRDFGFRPVIHDVLRAAGCIVGGFALVAVGGLAVRYRILSDSWWTAAYTIVPGIGLALFGVWLLLRAGYKAACGVAKG